MILDKEIAITEAEFNSIRAELGVCSIYTFEDGNWICKQFYNKAGLQCWKALNNVTGEKKFFK